MWNSRLVGFSLLLEPASIWPGWHCCLLLLLFSSECGSPLWLLQRISLSGFMPADCWLIFSVHCDYAVSVNEAIWCKHHLNYNHIILPSLIKHQFSTAGFNVVAYFPNRNFYRTYGLITHYRKQFYNPHPKYIRVLTFTNYNFFLFLTLFCVSLCAPMYVWRSENNSQKPIFTRDPRMELMFIRLGSFPLRICYFYVYVCGSVHTNTGTEAKGIRFS